MKPHTADELAIEQAWIKRAYGGIILRVKDVDERLTNSSSWPTIFMQLEYYASQTINYCSRHSQASFDE
jgi:hypothetical protein